MVEVNTYDNEKRYIFSNWSNEDFVGVWAGVSQTIKAGETTELVEYKAYNYTRHFVNREMMKDHKENSMDSAEARAPYEAKTVALIGAGTDSPALAAIKEKIKEEVEVELGKKPKKITPKDAKSSEVTVKEFEDIK